MTTAPATIAERAAGKAAQPTRAGARAARDPFFDNAKFLLVVLVVVGHNWAMLIDDMRAMKAAYIVLYSFHMPAFVLLCGYFSRSFTGRPDQIRKLVTGVLLPYLIFEAVYEALHSLMNGTPFAITPTTPSYLCWFLMALFIWRLTAPVWQAVRWPVAVSVAVSLTAGVTMIGADLGLPRVLQFLPWFVLGLRLRPEHFQMLRRPLARRCGLAVFAAAALGAWWLAARAGISPLLMQFSNDELAQPASNYLVMRLAMFVVAAALIAAFLAWVPRQRAAYTALGAATMYPFLLHGLVVKAAEGYGVYDVFVRAGLPGAIALTLLAVALAVGLFSAPVRRATRWLVEPEPGRARPLMRRRRKRAAPAKEPVSD
jgi:fucose 4-O-acetylase-like acetyltransferase